MGGGGGAGVEGTKGGRHTGDDGWKNHNRLKDLPPAHNHFFFPVLFFYKDTSKRCWADI